MRAILASSPNNVTLSPADRAERVPASLNCPAPGNTVVTDPPDALVSQNGAGDGAALRQLARNFIYAAFPELARVRVIPTSDYRRLLQVGRDYMGGDVMFLDAFKELEARLQQAYPARFSRPLGHLDADFPNSYIFSLLEGVIARTYPGDQHPDEDSVDKSIDEFIGVLEATERDFYYCRAVSHLTTKDEGVARSRAFRSTLMPHTLEASWE